MARDSTDETPIESRDALVAYLEAGCKPQEDFRIGTEHEKFGFTLDGHDPVPYEGETGVGAILTALGEKLGWEPISDNGLIIGLADPDGGGAISIEPGGQFELSGAPLETVHQTCREVNSHLADVQEVAEPLGVCFLGLGFSPKWTRDETPVMPKGRYDIMRAYMPKVGSLGLDMMLRTSTIQVNLDFSSEADMVKKMRVGLALQPVATAIFANSPFTEGKPNGLLSLRSEIWRDTDPDRTGMLPFAFEDGFGFEAYADYALDVPMYFLKRGDDYIDVTGTSFRDLMDGTHPAAKGKPAYQSDWVNHLSTIFPEVRLKRFLEMRGADGGPWRRICALPALWVGILYDDTALDDAWELVRDWTAGERQAMRDEVPKTALQTPFRNRTVRDIARDMVAISRQGLARRARAMGVYQDETHFLADLEEIVATGVTPAERLLEAYHAAWAGDIERVFSDYAY
ncbi:MAG: glutamate--cysteine ligase [Pseudomonadota bacterium]